MSAESKEFQTTRCSKTPAWNLVVVEMSSLGSTHQNIIYSTYSPNSNHLKAYTILKDAWYVITFFLVWQVNVDNYKWTKSDTLGKRLFKQKRRAHWKRWVDKVSTYLIKERSQPIATLLIQPWIIYDIKGGISILFSMFTGRTIYIWKTRNCVVRRHFHPRSMLHNIRKHQCWQNQQYWSTLIVMPIYCESEIYQNEINMQCTSM